MLRGRLRKLAIHHGVELIVENASDADNTVRFALHSNQLPNKIMEYIATLSSSIEVTIAETNVLNPVLSKLKVNKDNRYTL